MFRQSGYPFERGAESVKWNRTRIEAGAGQVDAIAPQIVSASRATDIPAFHADWLVERIRRLGRRLAAYTTRFVFSFADIAPYWKVQHNLRRAGCAYREAEERDVADAASGIAELCQSWGIPTYTCAEVVNLELISSSSCPVTTLPCARSWGEMNTLGTLSLAEPVMERRRRTRDIARRAAAS